jgi:hypothetical protein
MSLNAANEQTTETGETTTTAESPAPGVTVTMLPPDPATQGGQGGAEPPKDETAQPTAKDEPDSWDRIRADVPPEVAARIAKLEGELRRDKSRVVEERAAKAATEPVQQPASDPSKVLDTPIMRRLMGLEQGDPYEGIDVTAGDVDFTADEPPEDALTSTAALKTWMEAQIKKAATAAVSKATDYTRDFTSAVTKRSYEPIVTQRVESERAKKAAEVEATIRSSYVGMDDDEAYGVVLDKFLALHKEGKVRGGQAGFAEVYTAYRAENPDMIKQAVARSFAKSQQAQPAAQPVKEPEVIQRVASPARPADPFASMRNLTNTLAGGKGGGGRGGPSIAPQGLSEAAMNEFVARTPEFKQIMAGDHPGFRTKGDAIAALHRQVRGG